MAARSTHQRSRLLHRWRADREGDRHQHGRRSRRASRAANRSPAARSSSTNQVEKIIAWLAARGCVVTDLQKTTLSAGVAADEPDAGSSPRHRAAAAKRRTPPPTKRKPAGLALRTMAGCAAPSSFTAPPPAAGRAAARSRRTSAAKPKNTAAKFAAVMTGDHRNGAPARGTDRELSATLPAP